MITIGGIIFDDYEGTIITPLKRAVTYARTDKEGVGAQVLPKVGQSFRLDTVRYEDPGDLVTTLDAIDALVGTDVAIVTDTINYTTKYSLVFTVESLENNGDEKLVRARGKRGATIVDESPASMIQTSWQLRAGPAP